MMITVPHWLRMFYPSVEWQVKTDTNTVFITFDDGPHPVITPKVLDILDEFNAKATFFCVGDNVQKYPETYQHIINRGHRTANHSFNHINGWKTYHKTYLENIKKAAALIDSNLFRPPYGKITPVQLRKLKKSHRIIMWSVLTYDFSKAITPEQCLKNSLTGLKPGSIIVFHDSEKAADNMLYVLPEFLKQSSKAGLKAITL